MTFKKHTTIILFLFQLCTPGCAAHESLASHICTYLVSEKEEQTKLKQRAQELEATQEYAKAAELYKEAGCAKEATIALERATSATKRTATSKPTLELQTMDTAQRIKIVREVFEDYEHIHQSTDTLPFRTWDDLSLMAPEGQSCVLNVIDSSYTIFGKYMLANMLVCPTTDSALLHARQHMIRTIAENEGLLTALEQELASIRDNQDTMLSYWGKADAITAKVISDRYYGIPKLATVNRWLNNNKWALECKNRLSTLLTAEALARPITLWLTSIVTRIGSSVIVEKATKSALTGYAKDITNDQSLTYATARAHLEKITRERDCVGRHWEQMSAQRYLDAVHEAESAPTARQMVQQDLAHAREIVTLLTSDDMKEAYRKGLGNYKREFSYAPWRTVGLTTLAAGGLTACGWFYWFWPAKRAVNSFQDQWNVIRFIQDKLLGAAAVTRAGENLVFAAYENKCVQSGLTPENSALAVWHQCAFAQGTKDTTLATLLKELYTHTLTPPSSYFSFAGRVLQLNKGFQGDAKTHLIPLLRAIGEIDAYVSLAKLYRRHKAHFSFAHYDSQASTPYVCAHNFWHPMIKPDVVVKNSLTLGHANTPRNGIVTGPNAGGKSTILKGLTLNILLAQTCGLVAAESMTLTPFSQINTYLNITDDIGSGDSLFKAEVKRAQNLLNQIKALDHSTFVFTIMDEIFCGTAPKEGEAVGCGVEKHLGAFPHSISLLATHYPRITELGDQEPATFKNYKVTARKLPDGAIEYPYKIVEGKTTQNIAIDILQNEGFARDILNTANAILDN